ncbi:NAD(P)-dependent oxidoreductase [Algoriphagus sp.]|uniref:NAD-dependent epimerase/dehydratase family protein n=1 Tax=Algoriphagus sp. TaxID=1872435 RepID=UPI002727863C|nr:NAD-dependent epimerase/dehydratase family protein [Algoriphagus sp.]MDO8967466.1 NAD-dependent epimerase/dehydratase family protein [Algoriphagus sp.]MDP3201776.1 NAD-dependent epimerase/dehydratase family protein [Algoriphagus sp.]
MNKVLITGASGFLGTHVVEAFKREGISFTTLGRSNSCDLICDLRSQIPDLQPVERVIHLAGKAHSIPSTEYEKNEFFLTNFAGTKSLCDGFDRLGIYPKQFLFISSVSVYGLSQGNNILETTPLKGDSPYSVSKIRAENFLKEWGEKYNVKILIFRLPLIVGYNPPGNLGKMIRNIKNGRYFRIGSGSARKSMVLADDIAEFILNTSQYKGTYNLCDDSHPSFFELERYICIKLNKPYPKSIPFILGKFLGKIGDFISKFPINSNTFQKITSDLTFSNDNAKRDLGWDPNNVLLNKWV